MNIALYGGSFDCPHVGHQMACLYALSTVQVDRLYVIPTYIHAWGKQLTPFHHRLEMTERAMHYLNKRVHVSNCEELHGGTSLTINTVRWFHERYPEADLKWIIGADIMKDVDRWDDIDEIRRLCSFIVVGRDGYSGGDGITMPGCSSSEVRRRIVAGEPYRHLVPSTVADYIDQHGLYRAPIK